METARAANLSDRPADVKSRVPAPRAGPWDRPPGPAPLGLSGNFTHLAATARRLGTLPG
jgi:hypothetical protein